MFDNDDDGLVRREINTALLFTLMDSKNNKIKRSARGKKKAYTDYIMIIFLVAAFGLAKTWHTRTSNENVCCHSTRIN
jgi:hypothetical protein